MQTLMALKKIYLALHAYFTVTCLGIVSLLSCATVLAGIPDQEAHYDDGHSTCDEAHQESGHIDFLLLTLSCKQYQNRTEQCNRV